MLHISAYAHFLGMMNHRREAPWEALSEIGLLFLMGRLADSFRSLSVAQSSRAPGFEALGDGSGVPQNAVHFQQETWRVGYDLDRRLGPYRFVFSVGFSVWCSPTVCAWNQYKHRAPSKHIFSGGSPQMVSMAMDNPSLSSMIFAKPPWQHEQKWHVDQQPGWAK